MVVIWGGRIPGIPLPVVSWWDVNDNPMQYLKELEPDDATPAREP
jgi:hypothetical protein